MLFLKPISPITIALYPSDLYSGISDIPQYKSLGYKAIVIGDMGFKKNKIDPKIYEWLRSSNQRIISI